MSITHRMNIAQIDPASFSISPASNPAALANLIQWLIKRSGCRDWSAPPGLLWHMAPFIMAKMKATKAKWISHSSPSTQITLWIQSLEFELFPECLAWRELCWELLREQEERISGNEEKIKCRGREKKYVVRLCDFGYINQIKSASVS